MTLRVDEMLLAGLDGGHLLGFLAALGALRIATSKWPDSAPRMRWRLCERAWKPILSVPGITDRTEFVTGLHDKLKEMAGHAAFAVGDDLKFSSDSFRALALAAQSDVTWDLRAADFFAAFASEAATNKSGTELLDTALRTMSGTGHQHFVKMMRELVEMTDHAHLDSSLFYPWRYAEKGLGLRWDHQDDRRYALRWNEPTGDPTRTERGANRLAVEAIPLFPVFPVGNRLETTGFTSRSKQNVLTWPIWIGNAGLDSVRSVLALRELQDEIPPRATLAARGVAEIYRCQRITVDKRRNFTPPCPA